MAQQQQQIPAPNYPAMNSNRVSVIGPEYCLPNPVTVVTKFRNIFNNIGGFDVTDINGKLMFTVQHKHFSLHNKQTLHDPAGNPVLLIQRKMYSAHGKHFVYRGDGSDSKDLLFTVERSSMYQMETALDVYLASNTRQDACDFRIKASRSLDRAFIVYAGNSNTILAEMKQKIDIVSALLNKDKFTVEIRPNVDSALIVALLVILDQ